ncbi:hypothetical protein EU527_18015 [Candidatus Thorarchaeota archaeon]|nr:MAG: hypothetical protein EU527_18015 [Candidatus Thorarchaeota archaeon]
MKDEREDASDKIIKRLSELHEASGGTCKGCGYQADDNECFECEECGAPICTYCHNMTNDYTFICRACIESKGLTVDDVQFDTDGAGRPFF